jgi:glycosyltransferase involved in cell wall biosynthesis
MIVVNARFLTQQVTGVQRFAIEISKIICRLRPAEFVFVTPGDIINHEVANELNAKVIGMNKGTLWEQLDLRLFLLHNKHPLLINFCNTGITFYRNQIVTIHDMSYKVNPLWFSKSFFRWYDFLIPNLIKNSVKIFTVSNSAKGDILNYLKVKPEKINVIYNSSYLNRNNNFERIEQDKYILTVASLAPRKNLNNLIDAFEMCNTEVNLIIVGLSNSNFAKGFNINSLSSKIKIKRYQTDDELSSLMKYAEAFLYLSFYEGFGLPPIEAMDIGCPVLVSDIPAHKEICGNAALYANPLSVQDIKNKIEEILNNDTIKLKLKAAGKKNVNRFNWLASAQMVLKSIDEVA